MGYFKRLPVRYRTVLIIAAVFSTLFLFQSYLRTKLLNMDDEGGSHPFNWLREVPVPYLNYFFWALLAPLVYICLQRWPLTARPVWPNLRRLLLVGLVIAACHEVITSFIYYCFLYYLNDISLGPRFYHWAVNALPASILTRFLEFWALTGVLSAVDSYRRMSEEQAQLAETRMELQAAQLNMLKKQLQPHFLFNTLNTVSALMDTDVNGARTVLSRLGQLLRVSLGKDQRDLVPLAREVEHIGNYLGIEAVRFHDRLRVAYDIPAALQDAEVPSMVLQPLVENSIKHGPDAVSERVDIQVRAEQRDGTLCLIVSDNGKGCTDVSAAMDNGGIGLRNVRDRLRLLYGDAARFAIASPNGRGFTVELSLPLRSLRANGSAHTNDRHETHPHHHH